MYYLLCHPRQDNLPPFVPKRTPAPVGDNHTGTRTVYHYDTFYTAQTAAIEKMRDGKCSHVEIVQAIARIEPQQEFKTTWYEVATVTVSGRKIA